MAKPMPAADLSFFDTAAWQFDFVGEFSTSPDTVWAAFADNEGWARWFKNCKSCTSTSTPADGVGSTRRIDVNGLKVNERFIAWEPSKLWAFTVVDMNMAFASKMAERSMFTALEGGGTRVMYRMAVDPTWWGRPLRGLMHSQATKAFSASFATLESQLAAV